MPGCWRAEWGITQATYWENCHAAGKRACLAFPWILMAAAEANHQEYIILQIETAEHTGAGRRVIASEGKIKIGLGKQRLALNIMSQHFLGKALWLLFCCFSCLAGFTFYQPTEAPREGTQRSSERETQACVQTQE